MRFRSVVQRVVPVFGVIFATLFYNEYVVYYITLLQCKWPHITAVENEVTRAMFIADTHLLGPNGHWWDRLRREWQMQRTFQTALQLHKPNLIFILGDLFDEGKWMSDESFIKDVQRFHKMFQHSGTTEMVSVVGNHDVGFHYMMTEYKLKRFVEAVNSSATVKLIHFKGLNFVTVNSMAFEGDGCHICTRAAKDLDAVSKQLRCSEAGWPKECSGDREKISFSSPILLQHFPLFRESDSTCSGEDSAPEEEKHVIFKEKYDCLSKEASEQLLSALKPRLIISGHTHHFCLMKHRDGIEEWSVPSFSWRNKKGPSFLMVAITKDEYTVNKCFMPNENTVYLVYVVAIMIILIYILYLSMSVMRYYTSYLNLPVKNK